VQAWEQQVDSLSRQLSKAAAEKEVVEAQRQSLLESLRNIEQVRILRRSGGASIPSDGGPSADLDAATVSGCLGYAGGATCGDRRCA
jgi:hypothetical protein